MAKRKKINTVDIIAIIDRSGSMGHLTRSTIDGFNGFLKEQQSLDGKANLTLVLFDRGYGTDGIQKLYDRQDIHLVAPLSEKTYVARGNTPLYDAIGITLNGHSPLSPADKTIVLVITDGYENASTEYTAVQVKNLISRKKELGWDFVFLGANIEKSYAYSLGFATQDTFRYTANEGSTQSVYSNVTRGISGVRLNSMANTSAGINEEELNVV